MLPTNNQAELNQLLKLLDEKFNLDELETLCFQIGVTFENLEGPSKKAKARELLQYLKRYGRLSSLVLHLQENRRDIDLSGIAFGNHEYSPLPPKGYHRFIGRYDELEQIMGILRDPKQKMAAILGLGGIGKTALALEAITRFEHEKFFDFIVWISFKTEYFEGGSIFEKKGASHYFDDILNEIANQCAHPAIIKQPQEQKEKAIEHLLQNRHILIVMDNLETVDSPKSTGSSKLVNSIFQILGQSKLLITSRHEPKHDRLFNLRLSGFHEDDGVTFLRENSKERNIQIVAQAERKLLIQIYQATSGVPLVMKLVIGQMSQLPFEVVLDTLKQAPIEGEGYELYRFVYWHSWEILTKNSQMVLVDMSVFPPITGAAAKDIQEVSNLESARDFWQAIDQLVTVSLVDKVGGINQERYALLTITHYFVLSDIVGIWGNMNEKKY